MWSLTEGERVNKVNHKHRRHSRVRKVQLSSHFGSFLGSDKGAQAAGIWPSIQTAGWLRRNKQKLWGQKTLNQIVKPTLEKNLQLQFQVFSLLVLCFI